MQVANSNANKDRQVMSMNKSLFYIYRNLRFLLYLKDDKSSSATFSQFFRGFFFNDFFFCICVCICWNKSAPSPVQWHWLIRLHFGKLMFLQFYNAMPDIVFPEPSTPTILVKTLNNTTSKTRLQGMIIQSCIL